MLEETIIQQSWKELVLQHEEKWNQELVDFLKIPSVSTNSENHVHVREAAQFVCNKLNEAGADHAIVMETLGLPIVYGEKLINQDAPTLLIYGHFDVQPADPIELWDSNPFDPQIRDGKIFARGACDDKAQMMIPIKAFELLNQHEELGYNLKFLFEGEEEVGSKSLLPFIQEHKELLAADATLIVDTFLKDKDTPAVIYGVKGAIMVEIEITGSDKDVHSGLMGGVTPNPADELSKLLASLKGESGIILIDGFYDTILPPTQKDLSHFKNTIIETDDVNSAKTQAFAPTLEINGINSGYSGEGFKTIIPSKASAKLSIRTVQGQDPDKIKESLLNHFNHLLSKNKFKMTVDIVIGCSSALMNTDHWIFQKAEQACEETFDNPIEYQRMGGSIPVVGFIQDELKIPSLLLGFGLESDQIHSPNEHYHLSNYYRGVETIMYLLKREL